MASNYNNFQYQNPSSGNLPPGTTIEFVDLTMTPSESESMLPNPQEFPPNRVPQENSVFQFNWYPPPIHTISEAEGNKQSTMIGQFSAGPAMNLDADTVMRNLVQQYSMPMDIDFSNTNWMNNMNPGPANNYVPNDAMSTTNNAVNNMNSMSNVQEESETQEPEECSQSILDVNGCDPAVAAIKFCSKTTNMSFAPPVQKVHSSDMEAKGKSNEGKKQQKANLDAKGNSKKKQTENNSSNSSEEKKIIAKKMKEKLEKSVAILKTMPPKRNHFEYVEEMKEQLICDGIESAAMEDMIQPHKKSDPFILIDRHESAKKRQKLKNRKISSAPGTPIAKESISDSEESTLPINDSEIRTLKNSESQMKDEMASKNTMKVITTFHELKVHLDLMKSKKITEQDVLLMHIRAICKSISAAIDLTKFDFTENQVSIVDDAMIVLDAMISDLFSSVVSEFTLTDTGFPFLVEKMLNSLVEDCNNTEDGANRLALISTFFTKVKNLTVREMLVCETCKAIQFNMNCLYRTMKPGSNDFKLELADIEASFYFIQLLEVIVCHDGSKWLEEKYVDEIKALEATATRELPFPCITLMLARMSIYAAKMQKESPKELHKF